MSNAQEAIKLLEEQIKFHQQQEAAWVADPAIRADAAGALETTADRFDAGEYQWTQGVYENLSGEMCLIGSLRRTLIGTTRWGNPDPVERVARRAAMFHIEGNSLAEWNDVKGRTVHEVVEVMRLAAKDLRNQA